ncbi:ABC transporter ATP-binding protein [Ruminococcaceae bacterium OttesenSCG-928-D13]|nr:ABC transporter ATP-binding protein [Ruminococcaceae bacterium OttesenSCG-928-D13]
MAEKLLEVKNLCVNYATEESTVKAVSGTSFSLDKGETMGLVGETGAGKTTIALSIMQLVPYPPGIIVGGEIYFKGKNIIENTEKENQKMRGDGISMIFQDPMTALNPTMQIGKQMVEVVRQHTKTSRKLAEEKCKALLETVGIRSDRFNDYPHQLSGGMKQRVIIAMSLLCSPELLIADEPTTALDVTIQAQVLELMRNLIGQSNMSMILITHDLGVVAETCDTVCIMYAGEIVESGKVRTVYKNPRHPYTRGLFESIPRLDDDDDVRLTPIEGSIPNPASLPSGCKFHTRCHYCKDICKSEDPPEQVDAETGQTFKCHFDLFAGGVE